MPHDGVLGLTHKSQGIRCRNLHGYSNCGALQIEAGPWRITTLEAVDRERLFDHAPISIRLHRPAESKEHELGARRDFMAAWVMD